MRRLRTLLAGAAAAGLGLALVPTPSSAADAAVIAFTAGAEVGQKVYAPGLGPATPDNTFSFSTNNAGIGGQKACIGVTQNGLDTSCDLASNGTFGAGLGGLGAYCGWSSGEGTSSGSVAGVSLTGVTVEWPQSAGTVLPLVFRLNGTPIGSGAVQTTGAAPGSCGIGDGTKTFAVTGFAVLATA